MACFRRDDVKLTFSISLKLTHLNLTYDSPSITFIPIFHFILGNPRNKCALKPGHSLMDWVRLGSSNSDLAGTNGIIRPISYEELAKHDKVNDAWLAIRGKVYNVTKYMDFHPGGKRSFLLSTCICIYP